MSEIASTRPAAPERESERRLWFGLLAAPAAWTVNELVGVALVGRSCGGDAALETWQWAAFVGLALLSAGTAALAGATASRERRRRAGERSLADVEGHGRREFMALAGVIVSGFLLLNILFFGILPAIVEPCLRTP